MRASLISAFVLAWTLIAMPRASATVIPIGIGAFGPGSTLTTFTGLASGTEVNGLTVDGILFQYSLGSSGVAIGVGPNTTNNINPPAVVSNPGSDSSGILTMILPASIDTFGYGYALFGTGTILNGATISLFHGTTPVGSLSYTATPDPTFPGGFAGIQSTLAFNRVEATFNSDLSVAFALDNVRRGPAVTVPETTSLMLIGTGLLGMIRLFRRKLQAGD